jgi:outer membrane protein assembly factor BamB
MPRTIFCPNNHLILDAPRCAQCGWARPPATGLGEAVWKASVEAELGGPGRDVLAGIAALGGVAVIPLAHGDLLGLDLSSGQERWRSPLLQGRRTRALFAVGDRLLFSASDQRPMEQAETGWLGALDSHTGKITILWQAGTHQLSDPVLAGNHILLRTSAPELVALTRDAVPTVAWRRALQGAGVLQPLPAGEAVWVTDGHAMQGETYLTAFRLSDGRLLEHTYRPNGTLAVRPVVHGEIALLREGTGALTGLDLASARPRWREGFKRLYGQLCVGEGLFFAAARGSAPTGQAGHYRLLALDPADGKERWEVLLPAGTRPRSGPVYGAGYIFIGCDDGRLLAFESADGSLVWEFCLGSDEDPIRTELVLAGGLLLAGTAFGKAAALRALPEAEAELAPDLAFEQGDFLTAANGFALQGDFRRAAEVYAHNLHEVDRALALYTHGGLFDEAGRLAEAQNLPDQALEFYTRAGDLCAQAELLRKAGDELEAARCYERAGAFEQAAQCYEHYGDLQRAYELYLKLHDRAQVLRLLELITPHLQAIDIWEAQGMFAKAAEGCHALELWEREIKNWQSAGLENQELAALVDFNQRMPEPWACKRQAELARKLGRFQDEARAWEALDRPGKAAEAYDYAAQQAEAVEVDNRRKIAGLYESARRLYLEIDQEANARRMLQRLIRYKELPHVDLHGKASKAFREGEFNSLELELHNIGSGTARLVRIAVESNRFEIDQEASRTHLNRLEPEGHAIMPLYLRPQPDQVGGEVPLVLTWCWEDAQKRSYQDRSVTPVPVKRRSDATGSQPIVIQAQNYVQGDYIAGDQLAGAAQKGDRVEIGGTAAGAGVTLTPAEAQPGAVRCPTCHLPVKEGDQFCTVCGARTTENH